MSRRNPLQNLLQVLALTALFAGSACTQVRFASDYDEHIDRSATTLQQEMDAHLSRLEALGPGTAARFASNAEFYRDYGVAIRSVRVRAQGHDDNRITMQQLSRLEDSLEELRDQHRSSDTLSAGYITTTRELFNTAWGAVIAWEIAKKRGDGS